MSTTIEAVRENRAPSVSARLPPGPRDWHAYRLVKVEQRTTREAAAELKISQTRVCQLIARVVEYLAEVAPGAERSTTRAAP